MPAEGPVHRRDVGQVGGARDSTPIARATAWPEGRPQVSWRSRLRWGSTMGALWVCGAIAGSGNVKSTLEMVVSIFLLFLTCPSPRSKKVSPADIPPGCRVAAEQVAAVIVGRMEGRLLVVEDQGEELIGRRIGAVTGAAGELAR